MTTVVLPGTSRRTSRLGFGCSRLSNDRDARESLALLEAAYDAGIRHFDVAPLYGLGNAEAVLGRFLADRRDQVTVTTKYGLRPPRARSLLQFARTTIKPIAIRLPGVKAALLRSLSAVTPPPRFSPAELRSSLHASLRALRRERIDILLLHEANEADLTDELRSALDRAVGDELVGAWGIGSERAKIDRIAATRPGMACVFQFEWSVLSDRPPVYDNAFVVTYQALSGSLARLTAMLAEQVRRRAWSDAVGVDFDDPRTLPHLMLGAALAANADGIVLFSSKHPDHVRGNAALLCGGLEEPIRRFRKLIATERLSALPRA